MAQVGPEVLPLTLEVVGIGDFCLKKAWFHNADLDTSRTQFTTESIRKCLYTKLGNGIC